MADHRASCATLRFATRSFARHYQVYNTATLETVEQFPMGRKESTRAAALGKANAMRDDLNAGRIKP